CSPPAPALVAQRRLRVTPADMGRPAAVTYRGGSAALRGALPAWLAVNAAVALAIGHAYVASAGMTPAWDAALYAHVAFAATILASVTLLGALCAVVTFVPGGALLVRVGAPAAAAALLGFLWVDRAAFETYRFHVGGLAWNTLGVPGALAELGVRPSSPPALAIPLVVVAVLDGLLLRWFRLSSRGSGRRWWVLATTALVLLVAERTLFLRAERSGRRDVLRMMYLVPFFPTLVSSDLADVAPAIAAMLSGSAG